MKVDDKIYKIIKKIMIEHGENSKFSKQDNLLNVLPIDSIICLEILAEIELEFHIKFDDDHINIKMLEDILYLSEYVTNLIEEGFSSDTITDKYSGTVAKSDKTVDYELIDYNVVKKYFNIFKDLGICHNSIIGLCINDSSIIMPLVLSLYDFENTIKFMNYNSIKNQIVNNYYNCNFYITDFKCNFKVDVVELAELEYLEKKIYIYYFVNVYAKSDNDTNERCYVYYTSGTHGIPKEIYKTEQAVKKEAEYIVDETGIEKDDRILCIAPCSHVYAQSIACWAALFAKAKVKYCNPSILPSQLLDEIKDNYYNILLTTPFYYNEIYDFLITQQNSFKLLLCAGSFPSKKVLDSELKLNYIYGTTETGMISIQMYKHGYKKGSVGRPLKGVEIVLNNANDTNKQVRMGQFSVRSPFNAYKSIHDGYKVIYHHNSIMLSDYGYIDESGEVFLQGRIDNIININGEKVSSTEIELILSEMSEIKEVKVIKGKNQHGEYPIAYIVPNNQYKIDNSVLKQKIRRQFLEKEESYKLPKKIIFTDSLKRTLTGKIIL